MFTLFWQNESTFRFGFVSHDHSFLSQRFYSKKMSFRFETPYTLAQNDTPNASRVVEQQRHHRISNVKKNMRFFHFFFELNVLYSFACLDVCGRYNNKNNGKKSIQLLRGGWMRQYVLHECKLRTATNADVWWLSFGFYSISFDRCCRRWIFFVSFIGLAFHFVLYFCRVDQMRVNVLSFCCVWIICSVPIIGRFCT